MANPTIGATTPRIQYTATGGQTVFTVPFEFLANADLAVYVNGTLQTLTTHYTLTGANTTGGGTCTFVSGRTAGDIVTIIGNLAYSRSTNKYTKFGLLPAEVLEADFDALQVQAKQLALADQFAIRAPMTDSGTPSMSLPVKATRANKAMGFSATGDVTLSSNTLSAIDAATTAINTIAAAPSGNSASISHIASGTGAVATTVQAKLRETVSVKDFGAVGDGITSDTSKIQACFDSAAANSAKEVLIDAGNYLLTNTRNDASYTCAVVIKGLKNCVVRGAKGAKFSVSDAGSPVVGFGFFRVEECENVTFTGFELDGSGVAVTTGSNRLFGIGCVNFDVNSPTTDLPTVNKQLEFSHLYIHDSGGGIQVIRKSLSLADTPMTEGLSVHDCRMENLLGVDHGVAAPRTRNIHVFNNSFVNDIATVTIQDNMAVDVSSGAEVAHIHNNYVYGFVFGMKCESIATAGPSGTEVRASKRVTLENNRLEEIGDPVVLIWPGPSGGDTFGIKVNGRDCLVIGNTVKPRTIGVTTGGLGFGIAVVNTHNEDSHVLVEGNVVFGCQYGIVHNDTTSSTLECSVVIRDNRLQDVVLYGILAQANCLVENNKIYRAGLSAISIQSPIKNTFIKNNFAYNCASTNNAVTGSKVVFYQQDTGSHGFFTFEGNVIVDDRGASAAEYGYFFRAGTVYTNAYIFTPGYTTGLLTGISFDKYFSVIGTSLAVDGTTSQGPRTIYTTNSPSIIAPWNTMTWKVGDRAIFQTPGVGQPKAWVCTVAGTPGTWVSEGNL